MLAVLLGIPPAWAELRPPLLPAHAFRSVAACPTVDPFSDPQPDRQERWHDCQTDLPLALAVRTPKVRPQDTGPGAVELDVDSQLGLLQRPGFSGVARLGLRATTDPLSGRLQPRRGLVAAKGTLRLSPDFALDLGLGRDVVQAPRSRASATAIYRPEGRHLLYLQVAADKDGTVSPAVGLRWWLMPGAASLDLSARRAADDTIEPRLGLRWRH